MQDLHTRKKRVRFLSNVEALRKPSRMISDVHAISANIHNYRNSTWSKKFLRFLHSPNNCLCRYCFTLKSLHRRHHCGLSGFVGAGLWWSVAASSSLRPVPSARCSHAKVRRNSETAKRFHAFCAKKGTGGVPPCLLMTQMTPLLLRGNLLVSQFLLCPV